MSDRNDRKLKQVPVGTYTYRHEAEFAAGFLKSAGIPYRLQIEDPTLGLSASESATLWVHAVDERKAREVLDQEMALEGQDTAPQGDDGSEDDALHRSALPDAGGGTRDEPDGGGGRRSATTSAVEPRSGADMDIQSNMKPDLTLRERILAIVGGLGISSLMSVDAVLEAHPVIPWTVAIVAVALVVAGVLGRAPGPLKALLSSFTGDVP